MSRFIVPTARTLESTLIVFGVEEARLVLKIFPPACRRGLK